jgi:transmembrane sensor
VRVPEKARAEAAAWFARIRSDAKTAADESVFREWLAEDTAHVAAFEAMTDVWETLGRARRQPIAERTSSSSVSRRQWMLAGGAAAAMASVALVLRGGAEAAVYETGVGEQHHVVLADGTQAFLDTSTRLRMAFDGTTRLVKLECGRCNFNVVGDDKRPFEVDAAGAKIVAGHTSLDVARDGEDVIVFLIRGSAAVTGGGLAVEKPCVLEPGERLTLKRSSRHLDKPDLTRALAWQTGQIVFENVTLAEASKELNRYSVVKLEADRSAEHLRISGVFQVGDNVAFAQLATRLLPVAVRIEADRVQFTKDASRETKG